MSTTGLPIDAERVSRWRENFSDERKHEIANAVARVVATGPPKRDTEVPDLLELKGVLRRDGDGSERPGTTTLIESRKLDERKDEELRNRLRSDE